ncbi:unnamed protein product [Hermetia illucens]|uniref:Uncharacterized protein n=1 Tax=Hermetia illucens TaxID=343691 RepID=A0A7R8UQV7_HERIL|nr:unnamed protein product [Hermetia illucens]
MIDLDRHMERFWSIEKAPLTVNSNAEEPAINLRRNEEGKQHKRTVATVLQAIQCFKGKKVGHRFLSVAELEEALTFIIKHMHVKEFNVEIKQLRRERPIDSKSKLTKLTPFLDDDTIIRVGGRLQNASIPYTAKHPAILPTSHPFTKLLLVDLHKDNLHIATQALRASTATILDSSRQSFSIRSCSRMRSMLQAEPSNIQTAHGNSS